MQNNKLEMRQVAFKQHRAVCGKKSVSRQAFKRRLDGGMEMQKAIIMVKQSNFLSRGKKKAKKKIDYKLNKSIIEAHSPEKAIGKMVVNKESLSDEKYCALVALAIIMIILQIYTIVS